MKQGIFTGEKRRFRSAEAAGLAFKEAAKSAKRA
jgi:hypothetical protein